MIAWIPHKTALKSTDFCFIHLIKPVTELNFSLARLITPIVELLIIYRDIKSP